MPVQKSQKIAIKCLPLVNCVSFETEIWNMTGCNLPFLPGFLLHVLQATKSNKEKGEGREKNKIWMCYIYQKDNWQNEPLLLISNFSDSAIFIYQQACTCTTGKIWMKSNPCIWCGSKRWGHFILGKTDTIFSVKALEKGK